MFHAVNTGGFVCRHLDQCLDAEVNVQIYELFLDTWVNIWIQVNIQALRILVQGVWTLDMLSRY